ncbi:MAG: hypothetical protein ACTSO8_01755 [Promethearchaeota archaeon]
MVNDDLDQIEQTRNIPRSKDNAFNIRQLSIREFEAFMILLIHEGEVQSTLKQLIDIEFDQKSPVKKNKTWSIRNPTKSYDYINNLVRKGFAYKDKDKTTVKGSKKKPTRIYVRSTLRKKYERFMLPTISSLNDSINDIIKEYSEGIKEEEKIRDKIKTYTETIILALDDLLTNTPVKSLGSKRFQKKIYDTIWKYYQTELIKYEVFSK